MSAFRCNENRGRFQPVLVSLATSALCFFAVTILPARAAVPFSFGSNSFGQTGLGFASNTKTSIATAIDLSNLAGRSITQASAGYHSLLLAGDGTVFSFGDNTSGITGRNLTSGNTVIATPIDTTNLAGKSIKQVSAGVSHSLLLADDGAVYSFGDNVFGVTGLGTDSANTPIATAIDTTNLGGKNVSQVAAGNRQSLLLADDGSVYSFGSNSDGVTGLGLTTGDTLIATAIDTTNIGSRKIVQVAAGSLHNLLLADDGTVFAFGHNGGGQTGLGIGVGNTTIATAINSTNLAGKSIVQVSAGFNHSLLLASDGSVFSFGENTQGITGMGVTSGQTLIATTIDTSNLTGKNIIQIDAGGPSVDGHSLLLADDGTAFSFGGNFHGGTGLGTTLGNTSIATEIETLNLGDLRVTSISAGVGLSLVLAVPEPAGMALVVLAGLPLIAARARKTLQMPF